LTLLLSVLQFASPQIVNLLITFVQVRFLSMFLTYFKKLLIFPGFFAQLNSCKIIDHNPLQIRPLRCRGYLDYCTYFCSYSNQTKNYSYGEQKFCLTRFNQIDVVTDSLFFNRKLFVHYILRKIFWLDFLP
jgi:hypothetical protein